MEQELSDSSSPTIPVVEAEASTSKVTKVSGKKRGTPASKTNDALQRVSKAINKREK